MESRADDILQAALQLPEGERIVLVSRLLESIPAEESTISVNDPAIEEELQRRFANREDAIPWSQLRDEE